MNYAKIQKWVLVVGASLLGAGFLLAVQKPGIVPFYISFGVMVVGVLCLVIWLTFLVPTKKNNCGDAPCDKSDERSEKEEKTK